MTIGERRIALEPREVPLGGVHVPLRPDWEAGSDRFGVVEGHDVRIPAPPLPDVRLMPRGRRI